jgi:hypothetical protein
MIHALFGRARNAAGQPLYEVVSCTLVPGLVRTNADSPSWSSAGRRHSRAPSMAVAVLGEPGSAILPGYSPGRSGEKQQRSFVARPDGASL